MSVEGSGKTPACNEQLRHHVPVSVSYIDPQGCHKAVDLLGNLEESDGTEEPDEHISGHSFLSLFCYGFLYLASVSSAAKTGMEQNKTRQETSTRAVRIGFLYFMDSSFHQSDNGFARKVPTMLVNSRRHHAFINNRKNCPPSIRHQEWKMFPVDWEAPVAKATGAV